jgi:hypothetical protein
MTDLMVDPEVGIELHRVVHGEQRFAHERSVVAAKAARLSSVTSYGVVDGNVRPTRDWSTGTSRGYANDQSPTELARITA